jgi:ankyrin repeat protein
VFLQISLLVYGGLITQYSGITSNFQKDSHAVESYSFPLTLAGTLLLRIGMGICSHVVGSSTEEEIFIPAESWRARLVWLQQQKTVGDQEFKSFALFTKDDQPNIITSSRVNQDQYFNGKKQQGTNQSGILGLQFRTLLGTAMSLTGYVGQFVGIRGMHWSFSVASLVVVLAMALARALARRGLMTPMFSQALPPEFELDWFADTLRNIGDAPWVQDQEKSKDKSPVPSAKGSSQTSPDQEDIDEIQDYIMRRQMIAKLAGSRGPVARQASLLARTMEAALNSLHYCFHQESLSWTFRVQSEGSAQREVKLSVTKGAEGCWEVDEEAISAALSLGLFHVKAQRDAEPSTRIIPSFDSQPREHMDIPEVGVSFIGPWTRALQQHIMWWIPKMPAAEEPVLYATEVQYKTAEEHHSTSSDNIEQPPSSPAGVLEVEERFAVGLDPRQVERLNMNSGPTRSGRGVAVECDLQIPWRYSGDSQPGRWKFALPQRDPKPEPLEGNITPSHPIVYVKTTDTLETLYAKDMFATFMWAVVKSIDDTLPGLTRVKELRGFSYDDRISWKTFMLENDNVSNWARAIESVGLCTRHEAFRSIIAPLSMQQKLPEAPCIVEMVRRRAGAFEAQQRWREAAEAYLWLRDIMGCFPVQSLTYAIAAAVLTSVVVDMAGASPKASLGLPGVQAAFVRLKQSIEGIDEVLIRALRSLWSISSMNQWEECYDDISDDFSARYPRLWINSRGIQIRASKSILSSIAPDIFYRTRLHYSAMFLEEGDMFADSQSSDYMYIRSPGEAYHLWGSERNNTSTLDEFGIDTTDICGQAPLHYACRVGNTTMVRILLNKEALVNIQSRDGTTPLHCAAGSGHLEAAEVLIEHGAEVDMADGAGITALHLAAFGGFVSIVKALRRRSSRSPRDKLGRAAIHMAAIGGRPAVIDHLAIDVGVRSKEDETPLHLAALFGQVEALKKLLSLPQVDISARDESGSTALHNACLVGHDESVQALLDAGSPLESQSHMSSTPLLCAVEGNHEGTVRLLIERGANVEFRNKLGQTALHIAALEKNKAIAEYLLGQGADINAGTEASKGTPLHSAISSSNPDSNSVTRFLVEKGAWLEATDLQGQTALHMAVKQSAEETIKLLVEHGANMEAKDHQGCNPVYYAFWKPDILRLLLELGAEVNEAYPDGSTLLHWAVMRQAKETIKVLVQHGADVNARDKAGDTPQKIAESVGLSEWWEENTCN